MAGSQCSHEEVSSARSCKSICTSTGIYRRKYHLRAVFQSALFLGLVIGTCFYNTAGGGNWLPQQSSPQLRTRDVSEPITLERYPSFISKDKIIEQPELTTPKRRQRRRRTTVPDCDDIEKADPKWTIVWQILGVLYMFLALAIVCDEFFVPALEEMASSRRMDLSMDVAGATLMAAGGSAPELFSNLFGTFQESEIGFGTIIGSAVFNVLFVIAMCSIFSKEILTLTWWPLFRDSLCYTVGLVVLAIFVGFNSKEEIELWESFVLFSLYIVYILIMWKNADIYKYLTGKELEYPDEDDDDEDRREEHKPTEETQETTITNGGGANTEVVIDDDPHPRESSSNSPSLSEDGGESKREEKPSNTVGLERSLDDNASTHSRSSRGSVNLGNLVVGSTLPSSYFSWQGTFRAGILKLLRNPNTWVETGGMGIVAKLAGDADAVFQKIDENGDGNIDRDELKRLFQILDCPVSAAELEEVFNILDENKDGVISEEEFHKWYTTSAELIRSQVKNVFESLDTDNSGTIDKYELKALLLELDPRVTDEDCADAIDEMYKHGSREEITFEEFEEWYEHSIIYERQKKLVEEDMEGVWESLKPPFGDGFLSWLQYVIVFPLVICMALTIPDVRIPGRGKYCYIAFFMSIGWIGLFAYAMVTWAETIGNTVGIPSVIMGLTVLAAGTSVPDLLSSVIVARRGSGDMAVSSSIGSNIFDILVGLPVPWILYSLWEDTSIGIDSDNIVVSLILLIAMLVFVIVAVHCQGWKLTKTLGGLMILFYFGFLVQAIAVALPFETCVST